MTIGRILDNPTYTGDITYRGMQVADSHPALIDRDTWRRVREIASARTDSHTQRAMSDSDYYLTGLITCPACGTSYIGTSAKGRNRTYNYYTCYSRSRYGASGCTAPRLDAPAIDAAALHDLYSHADTLIGDAILRAQAHHRDSHAGRHPELDAIDTQIKNKTAAIERYHAVFENGTMDDHTAGTRLKKLRAEIGTLTRRRDEITDTIANAPTAPEPSTLERIRAHPGHVINSGTPAERKAVIEQLIAEIRITDYGIIPVFKIPAAEQTATPGGTTAGHGEPDAVRAMPQVVGLFGFG